MIWGPMLNVEFRIKLPKPRRQANLLFLGGQKEPRRDDLLVEGIMILTRFFGHLVRLKDAVLRTEQVISFRALSAFVAGCKRLRCNQKYLDERRLGFGSPGTGCALI